MQNHFIYAKSGKAEDTVATHPHRLSARYRRFLALVDGKRTVAELATVARPEEISETLAYLIQHDFIRKIGERNISEALSDTEDPFLSASMTPDMYEEFKRRAIVLLNTKFDGAARRATERIGAARTPAALRAALREAEHLVVDENGTVDPVEIRVLFQRIGRNLV